MGRDSIQALLNALHQQGLITRPHTMQRDMLRNLVRPLELSAEQEIPWETLCPAVLCFVEQGEIQRGPFLFRQGDVFYPEQFESLPGKLRAIQHSSLYLLSDWALNVVQNADSHSRQISRLEQECLQMQRELAPIQNAAVFRKVKNARRRA